MLSGDDMIIYHEYETLTLSDKAVYNKVLEQLLKLTTTLTFLSVDSEKVFFIYSKVLLDHPEFFWLKQSGSVKIVRSRSDEKVYFTPKFQDGMNIINVPVIKREVERAASEIVSRANRLRGEYEKILYVHDYIVDNTMYLSGADCHNIYGCLIKHRAVCDGYAATFQLLLHKLGITCGRVSGTGIDSASGRSDHEWNYCKIDNQYYYVDVTWDDPVSLGQSVSIKTHHYFCLSGRELSLSHRIERGTSFIPTCTSSQYNYFVYYNMYIGTYSYVHVCQNIANQLTLGKQINLKFNSRFETEKAVADLLKNKKIYNIPGMPSRLSYNTSKSGLILTVYI